MQALTDVLRTKKVKTNKLVLGFVGIAATTVIGTAGIAAAQRTNSPSALSPPSKAACVNYAKYGFKNRGQCVSWWELHNNPAHGYGGGSETANTSVNVNVSGGNHNVISAVIDYFF